MNAKYVSSRARCPCPGARDLPGRSTQSARPSCEKQTSAGTFEDAARRDLARSGRTVRIRPSTRRIGLALAMVLGLVVGCERQPSQAPVSGPQLVKTDCGMDMVPIPAGGFVMGWDEGS